MSVAATVAVVAATVAINSSRGASDFTVLITDVSEPVWKALFVIGLIGIVWGFVYAKREFGGVGDGCFFGFVCFFLFPAAALFVCGIGYGIFWLFN